jgi:hypothetical protein
MVPSRQKLPRRLASSVYSHCRHHADDQCCIASRTVIASPSGWVKPFDKNVLITCGLVNATFGECLNINGTQTITANHGAPTPQIFRVAAADLADSSESRTYAPIMEQRF